MPATQDGLASRPLCTMSATLDNVPIGTTPAGTRSVACVTGGVVSGDRLSGSLLPIGGDFVLIAANGCVHIDVRIVIETDDGARIYSTYGGRLFVPPEHAQVLADPASRADADPTSYYFRTAPLFESGDERYAWLNTILAVGVGRLTPEGVAYDVHEIL